VQRRRRSGEPWRQFNWQRGAEGYLACETSASFLLPFSQHGREVRARAPGEWSGKGGEGEMLYIHRCNITCYGALRRVETYSAA